MPLDYLSGSRPGLDSPVSRYTSPAVGVRFLMWGSPAVGVRVLRFARMRRASAAEIECALAVEACAVFDAVRGEGEDDIFGCKVEVDDTTGTPVSSVLLIIIVCIVRSTPPPGRYVDTLCGDSIHLIDGGGS